MTTLSTYTEQAQTELFKRVGLFFAFGNDQFAEGLAKVRKDGVLLEGEKLVSIGAGGYLPKKNVDEYIKGSDQIYKEGRAKDLKENGAEKIIIRELYSYESFYTGDITDALESLKPYGFTNDQVRKAYAKEYPKADL